VKRVLVFVFAIAGPATARGDGAFPDELQILLPADRPDEILLSTTFGLLVSEDAGKNFYLACEEAIAPYAALYALGPPPDDDVFAASGTGLAISRDHGCTWARAGGTIAGAYVVDEFPDPSDATRVLAVSRVIPDGGGFAMVLAGSGDGGRTFGPPLYQSRAGDVINGVEIARAAPATLYLTAFVSAPPTGPSILRSLDGGATFTTFDQRTFSTAPMFLAAVDPVDPMRLYLRVRSGTVDDFAISTDGGATVRVAFQLPDQLSAFLPRADGTLLLGTRYAASFRSTDGGQTFVTWPGAPHLRALAERGADLYAAGDDQIDHFALARSSDGGATWQPLVRYADVRGPLSCGNLPQTCAAPWARLMATYGIGVPPVVDAGPASQPPGHPRGCGCDLGEATAPSGSSLLLVLLLLVASTRHRRRARRVQSLAVRLLLLAGCLSWAAAARADGAFPDSMALFLPADRPQEIVLATNFGLVISDDGGVTWHLVCEQAIATYVGFYQQGADDALYACAPYGLFWSRDGGCTWTAAGGELAGANVADVFPDPTNASRVLAVATPGTGAPSIFESGDGGRTFGAPLFTAPAAGTLSGVESARAAPQTVYVSLYTYPPLDPILARSIGGAPFQSVDEAAALSGVPRIAAVDPIDPNVIYLRINGTNNDSLAISRDAGNTFTVPLTLAQRMSAFLRRASGTLLVGTADDAPSFRSSDGGATFAAWPGAPHVRALAERGSALYVAADDFVDGYSVGASSDEGGHWTPLLHFRDIAGPAQCGNLPQLCAEPWMGLQSVFASYAPDGGAGVDAGRSSSHPAGGCGCRLGAQAPSKAALLLLALAFTWRRRARPREQAAETTGRREPR
jgi:MYXO-CTERM domain-containing protein